MGIKARVLRNLRRPSEDRLHTLHEKYQEEFRSKQGVHGVGKNEKGLVVFVTEDYKKSDFDAYDASPIKFVKTPKMSASDWGAGMTMKPEAWDDEMEAQVIRTHRTRPVYGGLSGGRKNTGTITMVVRDKDTKELMILSNNHVFADVNIGQKGDDIVQPGIADGGNPATDVVAKLERYIPLKSGVNVDCAVAKLVSDDVGRYGMLGIGDVWFVEEPKIGMAHEKTGRTTGVTVVDKFEALDAVMTVDYGGKDYTINGCMISRLRSAGGDSGSPVCERYTSKLIGVLFAGNGAYTASCKATEVFKQLNIELMPCPYPIVLDLSHHNGTITRPMVRRWKELNVVGVILKCSEGNNFKDNEFDNSVAVCEAESMPWSPYHFNRPKVAASAQYNWFMKCLGDKSPSFQPMADCEVTDSKNAAQITSVTQTLLSLIDAYFRPLGYKPPIVYTRGSWSNVYFKRSSKWAYYFLHAARWYVDQVKYSTSDTLFPWDWVNAFLWQCKGDKDWLGAYFGINCKHVDINYVLDKDEFDSCLVHVPPEPGEEPPETEYPIAVVQVRSLCIRSLPSTSGAKVGGLKKGQEVEVMEEISYPNGDIWIKIAPDRYCAMKYKGEVFVKYL